MPPVRIVILEGWMVGFVPLSQDELRLKHADSLGGIWSALAQHRQEDLLWMNKALECYLPVWVYVDRVIHIDVSDIRSMYDWRLDAERKVSGQNRMRNVRREEEARRFFDVYMPAYELYRAKLRSLRWRFFPDAKLNILVNKDKKVERYTTL